MSAVTVHKHYQWGTISVLWRRDVLHFLRQPSRLVGALGQPLVVWLLLGTGFSAGFGVLDGGYEKYFYPGIVVMTLLFASIFSSSGVIDDRREGLMQAVLAGPGNAFSIVLGKTLGATTVALFQSALLLLLAPMAGYSLLGFNWPGLIMVLLVCALALSAFGFGMAWLIDNGPGYHAIQMLLLVPLWVVSGAMFPAPQNPHWLATLMDYNPVTVMVQAVRAGLLGTALPEGRLSIVIGFSVLALSFSTIACSRRRS